MKITEYDISATISLAFFLGLYIVQFYFMFTAWSNGWNYRIVMDYNHYNEFWVELIMMVLSIPFVVSFLKHTSSELKYQKSLLKEAKR